MTTLVSIVGTVLVAALLVGWQIGSWIQWGVWYPHTLSSLIKELRNNQIANYALASADKPEAALTYQQAIIEQLLAMPALVPLLIVAALLSGFYIWLTHIERQSTN